MMKQIIKISTLTVFLFFTINSYPEDITKSRKNRLLIYDFISSDNYEKIKGKENNYQYYSIVIPEAAAKYFSETGKYVIIREPGPFSIDVNITDKKEKAEYIKKLVELGRQNKADYIITGSYRIVEKKIDIRVTVFNIRSKTIDTLEHQSSELGVQMKETTDILSEKISDKIEELDLAAKKSESRSPFTALYKPLSIVTLGVDSGYLFMLGDWNSLYKNSVYYAPFISFDIPGDFSITLKMSSIQSDSENDTTGSYSQIRILSSSLSIGYHFRFNSFFSLALTAGSGVTKTTIVLQPQSPFNEALNESISYDPNIDISTFININISSFNIRTGIIYKRIFYQDTPMDTGIVFAGAGIHF